MAEWRTYDQWGQESSVSGCGSQLPNLQMIIPWLTGLLFKRWTFPQFWQRTSISLSPWFSEGGITLHPQRGVLRNLGCVFGCHSDCGGWEVPLVSGGGAG